MVTLCPLGYRGLVFSNQPGKGDDALSADQCRLLDQAGPEIGGRESVCGEKTRHDGGPYRGMPAGEQPCTERQSQCRRCDEGQGFIGEIDICTNTDAKECRDPDEQAVALAFQGAGQYAPKSAPSAPLRPLPTEADYGHP